MNMTCEISDVKDPVACQRAAEELLGRRDFPQALDAALWATKLSPSRFA